MVRLTDVCLAHSGYSITNSFNNETCTIWLKLPILEKRKLGAKERKQLIQNHRAQAKLNPRPVPPGSQISSFPAHHVLVYNLATRGKQTEFPVSCEIQSKLIFINTADRVVVFCVCFR